MMSMMEIFSETQVKEMRSQRPIEEAVSGNLQQNRRSRIFMLRGFEVVKTE